MGSACCVAFKDRSVANEPTNEVLHRNIRHSPSWNIRWDNRVQVFEDESSLNWTSNGVRSLNQRDIKSGLSVETALVSEEGSPLENSQLPVIQNSPVAEMNVGFTGLPSSDLSIGGNSSEVKQLTETPEVSLPSPMFSFSSLSASPLASHGHPLPPSRWTGDSLIPFIKSPSFSISEERSSFTMPGWSYDSGKGSFIGSSDSWSVTNFHRSPDSEKLGRSSGCGVCGKLLTENSYWGTRKIIGTNELGVVSVLICGHVYHAECLENMTIEINKYDPICPVCTYGEKHVFKMSEKALKAELDLRSKNKSRKRIGDDDDLFVFDRQKSSGRGRKWSAGSSTKKMPFLRRHFSLRGSNSKGNKSLDNHSSWKRGVFWSKSSKH